MSVTKTRIKYFNEDKIICLIVDDVLADLIRNGTFSTQSYDNQSIADAKDKITALVGDIFDFQFAYPSYTAASTDYRNMFNLFLQMFPNSYEVVGVNPILYTPDMYDFNNKTMGITTSNTWALSVAKGNNGQSTYSATVLTHETLFGDLIFRVMIPIFKESEVANGKINTVTDSYFSFLYITYERQSRYSSNYILRFSGQRASTTSSSSIINYFADTVIPPEVPPPVDPYDPSGDGSDYSGSGGGPAGSGGTGTTGTGGLHDDSSDVIPTPSLPTDVAISSGLFTAYNPSASQLASFASALWNMQPTDINDVLRFLFGGDAFNAVIGLHLLPVSPSTGSSQNIKLGNWDTGVSAPKISSQYVQVSFGSLLLPEYWGNCIDYAPYTKIQLALPYIGIVDVDTDDVLGSTNTLTYNIDVLSGAICATLHCVKFNLASVIYQWSGACAVSLPFSGASYNSVLGAIAGIAAAGMGFASMAAGPIGAALPAAALAAGGGAFGAGSAASIMGTMKGKVQKSGSFGANSGALGIMTPYFILTRPVQSVPASWQADKGYPSNISAQLGTVTGYTEVSEINLECSGTEAEKKEIIDLLKKGVLF